MRTVLQDANTWRVTADVYSEIPLTINQQFNGILYMALYVTGTQKIGTSEKIVVEAGSRKKEIITRLRISVPKVRISITSFSF